MFVLLLRKNHAQLKIYVRTFIEKKPCPTEKKNDLTLRQRRMGANFKILHSSTFGSRFGTVRLGH